MSPISKVTHRRVTSRQAAREVLQHLVAGKIEPYLAYRRLDALCENNAARKELRPLFRMEGIEPDGLLSVTLEFQEQVLSLAKTILPQLVDRRFVRREFRRTGLTLQTGQVTFWAETLLALAPGDEMEPPRPETAGGSRDFLPWRKRVNCRARTVTENIVTMRDRFPQRIPSV